MPSPICQVKDGAGAYGPTTNGVVVTPGDVIVINLVSTAGVNVWTCSCTNTDETNSAATVNAGLVIDSVAKTATFTAPSAGSALIFQSRINSGINVNQQSDPTYTTTLKICTLTSSSKRVGALNESFENDATFGTLSIVNAAARGGGGGSVTWAADLLGSSSVSQTVVALSSASAIPLTTRLSSVTNPATIGMLGAANAITIVAARNFANSGNIPLLGTDASNNVIVGDISGAVGTFAYICGASGANIVVGGISQVVCTAASVALPTGKLTVGVNPASAGAICLPNNVGINFRNAANSANVAGLTCDASNNVALGDTSGGMLVSPSTFISYVYGGGALRMQFDGVTAVNSMPNGQNLSLGVVNPAMNSATNSIAFTNGTAPTGNLATGGYIYVSAGSLKFRGSAGTVTSVAPA